MQVLFTLQESSTSAERKTRSVFIGLQFSASPFLLTVSAEKISNFF